MKFFVTGVCGQLGHDVMNELASRGYEGIGSDIAPEYSGVQDNTAVTKMSYISLDITQKIQTNRTLLKKSMLMARSTLLLPAKNLAVK